MSRTSVDKRKPGDNPNRLLVIDDEPDLCEFIATVAGQCGFVARTAGNITTFLEQLDLLRPTVIVLDLQMPGVDGIELLRELGTRQHDAQILVISGLDSRVLTTAEQYGKSRGLNMLGALAKPIELPDLEAALDRARRSSRSVSVEQIEAGLQNDEFQMVYQPKLARCPSGGWQMDAAEALLRWQHPEFGMMLPAEFLPLLDASTVIEALTEWVLESVISQMDSWIASGFEITVAANLAPAMMAKESLAADLVALLNRHGVDSGFLMLEVSESGAMADPERTMAILEKLRHAGIRMAIDDFGTGYSSLTHLYRMPFSELKIDTSFIGDLCSNEESRAMVDSMIFLAHRLRMQACAEGVESGEVLDFLEQAGCDRAQGYYISHPIPADEIPAVAKRWPITKQ